MNNYVVSDVQILGCILTGGVLEMKLSFTSASSIGET